MFAARVENQNPSARNQNEKLELHSNAKWGAQRGKCFATATAFVVVAVAAAKYYLLEVLLLLLLCDLCSSHS